MIKALSYYWKLQIITLLLLFSLTATATPKYYEKHIVLVVDQTPKTSKGGFLKPIGEDIRLFLNGETPHNSIYLPSGFKFNPDKDFLEVFAYGLQGDVMSLLTANGDALRLQQESRYGIVNDSLFVHTLNALVHPYKSYSPFYGIVSSGDDIVSSGDDEYRKNYNFNEKWEQEISNIFDVNKTAIGTSISKNSGYGLSAFLPNAVIPFINREKPAQEYYIICVSTFQTGTTGKIATYDIETLAEIYGGYKTKAEAFNRWIHDFATPYQSSDWANMSLGGTQNGVSAIGNQIVPRYAVNTSVFISSNLNVSQASFGSNQFDIDRIAISFPKRDNMEISNIFLTIKADGKTIFDGVQSFSYNPNQQEYIIEPQTIELGDFSKDANLSFELTLYPKSENNELPYVFLAKRTIPASEIHFINDQMYITTIVLCAIALIILVLFILAWRGRKRKLESNVHNLTTRYSITTYEDGTVELPCWFVSENQYSVGIRVDGTVKPVCSQPRIPRKDSLYVMIDIEDIPQGLTVCINDNKDMCAVENVYYPIALEDEHFKFNLSFWIDPTKFDLNNLQRVKLRLRYKTETKLGPTSKVQYHPADSSDAQLIDFFIKSEIGIAWMGIDPGTSGSCVAIGRGGVISAPNIRLVECNRGTIIPSKLVFNKPSFNTVAQAVPEIDYTYGFDADTRWRAFSRYSCFQSIKKLLGYQKGDNNRINVTIPERQQPLLLSGLDLAHLLVKGLLHEVDDFKETLSRSELESFEPQRNPIRRAVVAIPNNYTLPKTLDMIQSIALTNRFDEVRPIFEAEAVLCNYLSKTAGNIHNGQKNIIVYDMGGATINLTVFNVAFSEKSGSIYYTVKTTGRIGYAVGGDNIDFALMKCIFKLTELGDTSAAREYQHQNRLVILDEILNLKKVIILYESTKDKQQRPPYDMLSNSASFKSWVSKVTGHEINDTTFLGGCEVNNDFTKFVVNWLTNKSSDMKKYVLKRIQEVTKEILSYPDVKSTENIDEIIFSGRSVLFPNVKETVLKTLKTKYSSINAWDGLTDTEVKTAVAYGACWYGVFNALVTFDNSRVASAYGFKLTELGKSKLNVLVEQNESFDGDSIYSEANISNDFASDGNIIEFFQIMGSPDNDKLFEKSNRYKINKIGEIPINVSTEAITLEIKRSNQVNFSVKLTTGIEIKKRDIAVPDRDITDENDEAYVFATSSNNPSNNTSITQ